MAATVGRDDETWAEGAGILLCLGDSKQPLATRLLMLFLFLYWCSQTPAVAREYDPQAEHVRGAIDVLRRARYRILMSRATPREQETPR